MPRFFLRPAISFLCLLIALLLTVACGKQEKSAPPPAPKPAPAAPTVLHLYNMGGVPEAVMKDLRERLEEVYPDVKYEGGVPFAKNAYIRGDRYWASEILKDMKQKRGNQRDIYLSIANGEVCVNKSGNDYAVFGLSYTNLRLSVVTYKRLASKNLYSPDNLFKVAIHELGHSVANLYPRSQQADGHCLRTDCLMVNAKGKFPYRRISCFCPACDKEMRAKGFRTDRLANIISQK